MAEPVLNCPRVVTGIGQRVAAGVPEHMEMNVPRRETGLLGNTL